MDQNHESAFLIVARHVQPLDRNEITEPALQPGLNGKLQRRNQLRIVRREDHLQQAAAEIRPIDPLSGIGEQKLFDHVSDMIGLTRRGRTPHPVEMKGVIDIH